MIIYAICLVFGLMFTLFSAFAGHLFGGHGEVGTGGHADAGFSNDGMPGVSFFSPTILASFLTAFGAFGFILSEIPATASVWLNAPISFVTALFVAFGVLWLMNTFFRKTQGSSEALVGKLVGTTASLASPIPENGVGEISYVFGGSRYSAPARSEDGHAIGAGKTVKITRIVGTQYFVEATS
ncbi:MAG TPA: NfeD family protein [Verrucomicrobiae bacterium]|jgi:membrane protein implicated in regulation of membrane protease activity